MLPAISRNQGTGAGGMAQHLRARGVLAEELNWVPGGSQPPIALVPGNSAAFRPPQEAETGRSL